MENNNELKEVKARNCVDVMLRSLQQHHVQLSSMADQKASILIGAEAVILTLILRYMREGQASLWLLVLGVTILSSAVFALLAVMPSYKNKKSNSPNWLFFSAFASLDSQQYMNKMKEIMNSDTNVYDAILNDVYQLGNVLFRKKYRYLGYSYRVLLIGLIITFCIVVVEWFLRGISP